jgi:two-component system, chemotaxis family, sensor kinase CheA
VLTHRGESVPFLRLRQRLSAAGGAGALENAVIVNYTRGRAALVIDELHGECQTVVKPLPRMLRGTAGLSGSAILPNGVIAFIIDVPALLQVEIDRGRIPSRQANESNQEKSCSAN